MIPAALFFVAGVVLGLGISDALTDRQLRRADRQLRRAVRDLRAVSSEVENLNETLRTAARSAAGEGDKSDTFEV